MKESLETFYFSPALEGVDGLPASDVIWLKEVPGLKQKYAS
jgi:hypothetical protein